MIPGKKTKPRQSENFFIEKIFRLGLMLGVFFLEKLTRNTQGQKQHGEKGKVFLNSN